MRSLALFGLAAVASAQLMPVDTIANVKFPAAQSADMGKGAISQSVPYNEKATVQSTYNNVFANGGSLPKRSVRRSLFEKRHEDGNCSPQPLGSGPSVSPDTPAAFVASPVLASAALNAQTPAGYVNTFQNLNASNTVPMGYLGYDSISSYDPSICSAKCDSLSGCIAFDLYFERDPTIDPGVNCTNPPSTNVIKCAYWGTILEADTAINDGQYCADFHMVIAGSNGYVKQSAIPVTGYNGTFSGGAAINAPTECNSYIGYQLFNDGAPFDPARCAAACDATSQYNIQYLNSRAICRFFDTYILLKNGVPQGQYCAMYTRSWDISYATNTGQIDTAGNNYTISYSTIYSNTTDPGAQLCNAACMSQLICPVSNSSSTTTSATSTTVSSSLSTSAISTTGVSSSTLSTTAAGISTTPAISTTKSASTTAVSSTSSASTTSKAATTTPAAQSTTKCTTTTLQTTTKATTTPAQVTTPVQTTTKAVTTTASTTSSAVPTGTGSCFKIRGNGAGYLHNGYIGLDLSGRLSYASSAASTVFTLDSQSRLCTANGKVISRTTENWFNPYFGYMSTGGSSAITCTKGSNNALTFSSFWYATQVWASSSNSAIIQGVCPGSGWDQLALTLESCVCPSSSGSGSGSGSDSGFGFGSGSGFGFGNGGSGSGSGFGFGNGGSNWGGW